MRPLALLLGLLVAALGCGDSASSPSSEHPLCVDGRSADGAYPRADFKLGNRETPPDMSFDAADGQVALHDYFEPCAAQSRLLVVRVGAPWCGTCRWHLGHTTSEIKKLDIASRVQWLDLLVSNRDNDPPAIADIADYRALFDAPEKIAIDPEYRLGPVNPAKGALPLYVLIDTRTMMVRNFLHDPEPETVELRLRQELAELDGLPLPPIPQIERRDDLFSRYRWDLIKDMTVPGAPPPDATNAKGDDPAAAALGKELFFDKRLSPSNKVSCGSCHALETHLQDGVPQSTSGIATVDRNAPAIALAAHDRWQFWDGRADTLWMQALGPLENDKEFASSRLFVAHAVARDHGPAYAAVFGSTPDLSDASRFPASGKPKDPSWEGMKAEDRAVVTGMFVNIGKAIAGYERSLRVKPNRLDAYIAGDANALDKAEKGGLQTFLLAGCAQCHWGPRLTDDAFHPDRYPTGRQDGQPDRGRIDGVNDLLASEFAQPHPGLKSVPSQLGSFKTTGLRGVANTAPYGHGGTLTTLHDAALNYTEAGLPIEDPRAVGATERWLPKFAKSHADDLVPFLQVLTADVAP